MNCEDSAITLALALLPITMDLGALWRGAAATITSVSCSGGLGQQPDSISSSSLLDQLPSTGREETNPLVVVDAVEQPTKAIEAALWEKVAVLRSEGYRVIEGESAGKEALKRLQFDGSQWVLQDR